MIFFQVLTDIDSGVKICYKWQVNFNLVSFLQR